jgi:hypothetical protein
MDINHLRGSADRGGKCCAQVVSPSVRGVRGQSKAPLIMVAIEFERRAVPGVHKSSAVRG